MAERKVLLKRYPPDFDPSKLIKTRRPRKNSDDDDDDRKLDPSRKRGVSVRMMLSMTVRCNTCGHFMRMGTKFNMRKETVKEDSYLGIEIYRFYFRC